MGSISRELKTCTGCGKKEERQYIIVMKVAFHKLGQAGVREVSRTPAWFCPECCGSSEEYRIPPRSKKKSGQPTVPCDICEGLFLRSEIMVKKVIFHQLGHADKTMRSRTMAWLCDPSADHSTGCLSKDEIWLLEPYSSSPGAREIEDAEAVELDSRGEK